MMPAWQTATWSSQPKGPTRWPSIWAGTEGLLLGISAAAAVAASLRIGEEVSRTGKNAIIVTILCDSADKYLSERFWEQ